MEMSRRHEVSCVLCHLSVETKTTGALSTKDQVTAHENCLYFSSGIYCRHSPQFDDLFGFSVEDVMEEVKRGSKLMCRKCKKKGATAGCEVKRCKKSYHYPCAVQDGAETVENTQTGVYGLFCRDHNQQTNGGSNPVNGCGHSSTKPQTSRAPSEAGPSKPASSSHKGNRNAAGPSAHSSDSSLSSSTKRSSCKRRFSFSDRQDESSSKRRSGHLKRIISDSSSDSDMEIFAPLESDLEESANSLPGSQLISPPESTSGPTVSTPGFTESTSGPTVSTPGFTGSASENQRENESNDGNEDEDEADAESQSLLPPVENSTDFQPLSVANVAQATQTGSTLYSSVIVVKVEEMAKRDGEGSSPEQSPVHSPDQHTAGPSVPQQSSEGPPASPDPTTTRAVTSSTSSPAPPDETICVSLLSSPASPASLPSEPEPVIHSTSFWKSCNAAGCTQAIFTDFINTMNNISSRIKSDQASQEDYDLALTVMEASGKLAEFVTKQQEELQRKQEELQKAAEAMKEVVSALRR
ncbi:proteoglycan 4-like isoform X2 [Chelmon rostratus]|uniref:proteoglycan 4-like isoform X2 n=1 Tax=Chelmon rostratus TaxID=109905 RepID=UPI001BE66B2F|nr:proteoglycan 4-like isoform X2 [Chelmon rostratus]